MRHVLRTLIPALLAAAVGAGCAGPKARPSKALSQPSQTLQLGAQAWRDGELMTAQRYFANAHAQYRSIDDRQGQLKALLNLGTIAITLGEAGHADRATQAATALLDTDDPLAGRVRLLRAQTHILSGNLDAARPELATLLNRNSDDTVFTAALIERARLAPQSDEPVQPWIERIRARVDGSTPATTQASLERLEAMAARQRGDTPAQIAHLNAALERYRSMGHRPGIAATHCALAEAALAENAGAPARDHFLKALHVQLWIQDRVHAARTFGELAALEDAAGNSEQAREWRELQMLLGAADRAPDWRQAQRRTQALANP